jgi:hypothetical protein
MTRKQFDVADQQVTALQVRYRIGNLSNETVVYVHEILLLE